MSKTVLITGGAKRIGREMALYLAKENYSILVHYHHSEEAAQLLKAEVEELGSSCHLCPLDLSISQDYDAYIKVLSEVHGPIDLLINNASVFEDTRLETLTESDFDRDFNVHLKAPLFLSQAFAKQVSAGQIIMLLDTRISAIRTDHLSYTLAKKSLADLTRILAKELAPKIRVNGISPGPILPPPDKDQSHLEAVAKTTPLQKAGSPEDIIRALDYLLEAKYVSGEIFFVDGGQHLN